MHPVVLYSAYLPLFRYFFHSLNLFFGWSRIKNERNSEHRAKNIIGSPVKYSVHSNSKASVRICLAGETINCCIRIFKINVCIICAHPPTSLWYRSQLKITAQYRVSAINISMCKEWIGFRFTFLACARSVVVMPSKIQYKLNYTLRTFRSKSVVFPAHFEIPFYLWIKKESK